jgi:Zn-dependent alcohol dehydrogenase
MGETCNEGQLVARHGVYAGRGSGRIVSLPAKRRRALLGSNLPRNSRPRTHDDPDTTGGCCLPVDRMVSSRVGLDELNEGFDRLQAVATVRQLLVPHG